MLYGQEFISEELEKTIKDLIQLDVDATFAYAQAIDGIDERHAMIRESLVSFRGDHERHINELSALLGQRGIEPPAYERDLKGFVIEGMTAVRAALGTKQSLKAMRQNERLTNKKYEEALAIANIPADVLDVLQRARDDEVRHLEFVVRTLAALEADGYEIRQ